MRTPKSNDVIDEAVAFLRSWYNEQRVLIRHAHAHAAVAHYLGYNSKVALKSDENFDANDPELICYRHTSVSNLSLHIAKMIDPTMAQLQIDQLARVIRGGLKPPCECCGEKHITTAPLGYDETSPDGWVCRGCKLSNDDEYGHCAFCGDHIIYRVADLNRNGECHEHAGESDLDDEELEDAESLSEYWLNH